MRFKYIIAALSCLFMTIASAQSLDEAKSLFNKGEYEKAKPIFKKYVSSTPSNGNYNLWYGVCCLKTDQPETALKYLEMAVKKRIPSGQLYLAQNYESLYRFEDAIDNYENYITDLKRRKKTSEEAEEGLERSRTGLRMLKSVQQICIIDSFVVDKNNFLSSYKLSEDAGSLYTYNQYFETQGNHPGTVYETELQNHLYYGELSEDSVVKIYTRHKLDAEWGKANELPERINGSGNNNYPYVMTDGVTIYYASTNEHSIGGYDIFVTRYNMDTDTYLLPQNIGMPFNSPYNDYMYVIDEFNNLGWFVSDRYQPEDKVCIYVFIPNESGETYNYEMMDESEVIDLAKIQSISSTWKDSVMVEEAQNRLAEAINYKPVKQNNIDFTFIIDDKVDYNQYSDFKTTEGKELFLSYQQKLSDLKQQMQKLDTLRENYANSDANSKSQLTPSILDLEKRVAEMEYELDSLAIKIRSLEKKQ